MSEETAISSGMETAEISVDSNQSEKTMHHHTCSPLLNFSISRLLSGGGGGGGGDRQNNNHIPSSKHSLAHHHHRHTIHYHGTQRDPTEEIEDERLEVSSRRGSRGQSGSPNTTERIEDSDSDVDVRNDSDESDVEMDDVDDNCSNNNNSSIGNNNNRTGSSGSKSVDHDNDYHHGSPESKGTGDEERDGENSNRSTPDSQNAHAMLQQHHSHLQAQLAHQLHVGGGGSDNLRSSIENLSSNGNNHDSPGQNALGGGVNPFPVFGYSSIFLPNFPCPITSPNQVIRVPAHRPMSNFQLFGQSALGQHGGLDLNATPLFSNFDPRNSLLLKDRLHGKTNSAYLNI